MIMDGDGRAEICPIAIAAVSTLGKILYCEATPPDCMEDKCAWWTGKECVVMAIARKLGSF
jgi:hypothetical protein